MSATIHVELPGPCDAQDLVEYLGARGLAASMTTNDHCELAVGYAVDPDVRLREEVAAALDAWLAERDRPLVPLAVSGRDYVLRPPAE